MREHVMMKREWCGEAGASGVSTRRGVSYRALRCQVEKETIRARGRRTKEKVDEDVNVAEDVDEDVAVAVDVAVKGERDLRLRTCLET